MDLRLEEIIEKLDRTRVSLENETNYAVLWLNETLDFLNNNDLKMALWSYGKYLEVLNKINMDLYQKTGNILQEKLRLLLDQAED